MTTLDDVAVAVEEPADPVAVGAIVAGLSASNLGRVSIPPEWEWQTLSVVARRGEDVVGGADGRIGWAWLYVGHLWVAEALRGAGLGARIMSILESAARARGCVGTWLDTFSFQARPFYESIGYRQFGELADFPPGHSRHFMWKRL